MDSRHRLCAGVLSAEGDLLRQEERLADPVLGAHGAGNPLHVWRGSRLDRRHPLHQLSDQHFELRRDRSAGISIRRLALLLGQPPREEMAELGAGNLFLPHRVLFHFGRDGGGWNFASPGMIGETRAWSTPC